MRERAQLAGARRVVVKVGSSSISGENAHKIATIVDGLAAAHARGTEVVLVSSGAIATGMPYLSLDERPVDLATQQAAAAVGQNVLIYRYQDALRPFQIVAGQVLLTAGDLENTTHRSNARRAMERLLGLRILPIVNENDTVATHEIRFGDNDRLAALVAHLVAADALVLLSDVDSLYTEHPSHPAARPIPLVPDIEELVVDTSGRGAEIGTGGMATKLQAARIATASGIPVVLAAAERVCDVLDGAEVGTLFQATGKRRARKLMWLAYASVSQGELVLDAGAVRAVTERKASLLPAGIVEVRGTFQAGDPVRLVSEAGAVVARGLVGYDSVDLPDVIGRSTRELDAERGPGFGREVVHRDDMVVRSRKRRPS